MRGYFGVSLQDITRLILVRHGRTAANYAGKMSSRADVAIDEVGEMEAERVAERLESFSVSALYASPQRRARETAARIAERLDLETVYREELMEFDFGKIGDRTFESLAEDDPGLRDQISAWMDLGPSEDRSRPQLPGAEPIADFLGRLRDFRDSVVDEHHGEVVVAVTHGGTIKGFVTLFAGGSLERRGRFEADTASLTVVDFYRKTPVIRMFNSICHLDKDLRYGRPLVL